MKKELFKKIYFGKIKPCQSNNFKEYSYIMENIEIEGKTFSALFYIHKKQCKHFELKNIKRIDVYNNDQNLLPMYSFGQMQSELLMSQYGI